MMNINSRTFTTGKIILQFPHLIKKNTRSKFENSQAKYDATIIISKNDNETLLKIDKEMKREIQRVGFSANPDIKLPLKDGDKDYPYNSLYENSMYMYVSTAIKPKIVNHKLEKPAFYMEEIQSGTYGKISMYFEGYKSYETGKCGISAKLLNVQVFPQNKLVELRSKPEDDFVVEDIEEDELED